jgi:hypothetical protein
MKGSYLGTSTVQVQYPTEPSDRGTHTQTDDVQEAVHE